MRTRRAPGGLNPHSTLRSRGDAKSRHARSTARCRPLPLPLRFHSDFFAGGIQKRNGRQEAGAALAFQDSKKRKRAGFKYKWSLAMQNSLRNGEAQNLYVFAPPALCAHKSPPFLGDIIKRRGWLPWDALIGVATDLASLESTDGRASVRSSVRLSVRVAVRFALSRC